MFNSVLRKLRNILRMENRLNLGDQYEPLRERQRHSGEHAIAVTTWKGEANTGTGVGLRSV